MVTDAGAPCEALSIVNVEEQIEKIDAPIETFEFECYTLSKGQGYDTRASTVV